MSFGVFADDYDFGGQRNSSRYCGVCSGANPWRMMFSVTTRGTMNCKKIIVAAGFGAAAAHLESAERMTADDRAGAGAIDVNVAGDDFAPWRARCWPGCARKIRRSARNRCCWRLRMASSRSRTFITLSTGPKISSHAMRVFGLTLVKIVGGMKKPFGGTSARLIGEGRFALCRSRCIREFVCRRLRRSPGRQ